VVGSNTPKLDITGSTVNLDPADPTKLDVRMKVANLSSLPSATDVTGGAFVDYLTSWNYHVPGNTQAQYDSTGNVYYAYLEVNTAATSPSTATTAYDGNTCSIGTTHPKELVYPGQHLITYHVNQAAGTIDLFVPRSDVGNPSVGSTLYSVTAHTVDQAAAAGPFDCSTRDPNGNNQDPAGQVFNVYDKSAAYTSILGTQSGDGGSCHEGDGAGHVRGTQAGTASFSMDADRCEDRDTDSVTYQDAGTSFQSTAVTGAVFNDVGSTHTVTLIGTGLVNNSPTTFVATAVDNGTTSLDSFAITLGNGYANSGTLLDGIITLH
jgi:hypothetical protein